MSTPLRCRTPKTQTPTNNACFNTQTSVVGSGCSNSWCNCWNFVLGTNNSIDGDNTNSTRDVATPTGEEKDLLVGRWVRTDSNDGFTIEIKTASTDGKLDAGYFNPNPIYVSRAEWQKKEGGLVVVVELRDVNYPGSTYTLNFSRADDRMVGTYYQAVEGVNFDVAFARTGRAGGNLKR